MTVKKPRIRTLSVRLSEDEYSALNAICLLTGARSVSDLTRDALRRVLRDANREDASGPNLEEFRAVVKSVEQRVGQLEAKLFTVHSENGQ